MEFLVGQVVQLKSKPNSKGVVVKVEHGRPESRIEVFFDGHSQNFYASQLVLVESEEEKFEFLSINQFHANLTALQIKYPGLHSLYSLNSARIDFIPYQFRPVLRFIRSDRPRLLIADSVGVGKTIEAGLILRELQARRDVRSVLIICPRPLIIEKKWLTEMKRFDESFTQLDGPTLRYCIEETDLSGTWPDHHQKTIIPYSLFDQTILQGLTGENRRKNQIGLFNLDPPPRFDLVIVDEAHHVRNKNTYRYEAVKFFCDQSEAVVFLTATPIQLGNKDLFTLLNLLRPDLIIDQKSFDHMAETNPFINQAVSSMRSKESKWSQIALENLNKASTTPWGKSILRRNPIFCRIRETLGNKKPSEIERVKMISEIEGLNSFSNIINRTRRRDIGNFTVRKPLTIEVDFTPDQQNLHDELLRIQKDIFGNIHKDHNVKFMMTTIKRQASSCIFGLVSFLEDILNRHLNELTWEEGDDSIIPQDQDIRNIEDQIQHLVSVAKTINQNDPKLNALLKFIGDKQELPNNKIMLFSSFRHTLNYLNLKLREAGICTGLIHGGTPDDERVSIRSRFEKINNDTDRLDILLFSEIGCEGLDYQFCNCIVNYDLPWNPMRIEQRIGRIDRHGQQSDSVTIVNLITPGTIDADIYNRCLLRIGVFENALGGSEEILGEITREIKNIAENYNLSNQERNNKFQQLADNKIRLIQEQEELEQKQAELFGIDIPEDRMINDISQATNYWLQPHSIIRMVNLYLQKFCGDKQEPILGEKPIKTLRLDQKSRNFLLNDFKTLNQQNTVVNRDWEKWLKGGNQHLSITFESDSARLHPEVSFIMPLHPLVKQAAKALEINKKGFTKLFVISDLVQAGIYEFVIYQWHYLGIKDNLILKPVSSNAKLTEHLNHLLETAIDNESCLTTNFDAAIWNNLDAIHYISWHAAKNEHKQEMLELSNFRKESLSASHNARLTLLNEQIEQATNEKIKTMRVAQITNAKADYARRIQELDLLTERSDILTSPVAYGIIQVKNEN